MRVSSFNLPFFWAFSIFSAYLVGSRDSTIGSDTENYISIFSDYALGEELRFEIGFKLFVYIFHLFGLSVEWFFAAVFLVVFFCFVYVLHFAKPIRLYSDSVFFPFSIVSFIFLSDWFFVAVANSLRQGVALALLYVSFVFYLKDKKIFFLVFLIFSCAFHNSVFIFIPFLFLFFFFEWARVGLTFLVVASISFGCFFYYGLLEYLVFSASNFMNLPLYQSISEYAQHDPKWVGFDFYFYIYIVSFIVLPWVLSKLDLLFVDDILLSLLRYYTALSFVYYFYGFAAYSNRYAFFSWLFVPIVLYAVYCRLNFSLLLRQFFCIVLFLYSCFYFFSSFL